MFDAYRGKCKTFDSLIKSAYGKKFSTSYLFCIIKFQPFPDSLLGFQ